MKLVLKVTLLLMLLLANVVLAEDKYGGVAVFQAVGAGAVPSPSTNGQILGTDVTGGVPTWVTVGGGPGSCSLTYSGPGAYQMVCTTYAPTNSPTFTGTITFPDASTWGVGGPVLHAPLPIVSGGLGIATVPTAGQLIIGQTGGTYALENASGDVALTAGGLFTVTKVNGIVPGGTCSANFFVTAISSSGVPTCSPIGNLVLNNVTLTGTTTVSGPLTAAGPTTLNGTVTIPTITGNTSFTNSITVIGSSTFNGPAAFDSTTTFNNPMTYPDGSTYTTVGHNTMKNLGINIAIPANLPTDPTVGQIKMTGGDVYSSVGPQGGNTNWLEGIHGSSTSGSGWIFDFANAAEGHMYNREIGWVIFPPNQVPGTAWDGVSRTQYMALRDNSPNTGSNAGLFVEQGSINALNGGIGAFGYNQGDPFDAIMNINSNADMWVYNQSSGNYAQTSMRITNDLGRNFWLVSEGSGFNCGGTCGYSWQTPNTAVIEVDDDNGLNIVTTSPTSQPLTNFWDHNTLMVTIDPVQERLTVYNITGTGLHVGDAIMAGLEGNLNLSSGAIYQNGSWRSTGSENGPFYLINQIPGVGTGFYVSNTVTGPGQFVDFSQGPQGAIGATGFAMVHQTNFQYSAPPTVNNGAQLQAGSRDSFGEIILGGQSWVQLNFARQYVGNSICTATDDGVPWLWYVANKGPASVQFWCVDPRNWSPCPPGQYMNYHCAGLGE